VAPRGRSIIVGVVVVLVVIAVAPC
jgi:hypothetical protein